VNELFQVELDMSKVAAAGSDLPRSVLRLQSATNPTSPFLFEPGRNSLFQAMEQG